MKKEYWVCIIEPKDMKQVEKVSKENNGLDSIPRSAVIEKLEKNGVEVKYCWSGWGCDEKRFIEIMKAWNKEK